MQKTFFLSVALLCLCLAILTGCEEPMKLPREVALYIDYNNTTADISHGGYIKKKWDRNKVRLYFADELISDLEENNIRASRHFINTPYRLVINEINAQRNYHTVSKSDSRCSYSQDVSVCRVETFVVATLQKDGVGIASWSFSSSDEEGIRENKGGSANDCPSFSAKTMWLFNLGNLLSNCANQAHEDITQAIYNHEF